MIFARISQ